MAIAGGHLSADFDPDTMHLLRANMTNTVVPAHAVEELRDRAWEEVNLPAYKASRKAWVTELATAG